MISRRSFLSNAVTATTAAALAPTAKSYARVIGANDRLNFAVIGLNSRAYAHLSALKANSKDIQITHICDVESNIMQKFADRTQKDLGYTPKTEKDFRKVLASSDVDAITIATPDHWHAPMAIAGVQAGKHVYVEKPCSHNPAEGAMLVAARDKSGKLVQMGTQQRSSPHTIKIVGQIHDGLIGRAYAANAWYANTRKSIGVGKPAPVPATLDWDLFQGPAPRVAYKDNVQPYNWHWFKIWGTGETLNNGTHEVDVSRWALGVEFPKSVTATGGRYAYKDDWQFYDTLTVGLTYDDDKMISWDNKCCNGMKTHNRDRGTVILGTTGSVLIDRGGYEVYDLKGKKTDEFKAGASSAAQDLVGADSMTDLHFANFIAGIRTGEKLHAPIEVGNVAVTSLQLANIAWENKRELHIDPKNGHILNDAQAMKSWGRTYEPGWAPKV